RFPALKYGDADLRSLGGYLHEVRKPKEERATAPSAGWPLDSELVPWARGNPWYPGDRKRPLVLVCTSGGGAPAAACTAAMLCRLEEHFAAAGVAFPYHVRLIAGASGGMLGASYYAAPLEEPAGPNPAVVARRPGLTLDRLVSNVSGDFLSDVVFQMVYGD